MRVRCAGLGALLLVVALLACSPPSSQPGLVLVIVIDQMRADYLERFGDEFTGGIGKLYREGVVYTNADLNYASSETAPGHATLATGCYPGKNGILSNGWRDRQSQREVYCVDDSLAEAVAGEGRGRSPRNLAVTAFGDWLKAASPASRVITTSIKDRAAILMGGKRPDYAFWYNGKTGHLVTSSYYTATLPQWVSDFNAANWIDKNVPAAWTKLKADSLYDKLGPDELAGERVSNGTSTFPHAFPAEGRAEAMITSPWGDMQILDFALAAMRAEKLGRRGPVDYLGVSLTCTDYVGHAYGPDSHEMYDHLLRLDLALGEFLDKAEQFVGRGRLLVAVSADHAVMPLPEHLTQIKQQYGRRILYQEELKQQLDALQQKWQKELGLTEPVIIHDGFLNYAAAAQRGLDSLALERKVREGLLHLDGVEDVYFRRELLDPNPPDRAYLGHFRRSYFPARGEDFQIRFCEFCLVTSHGTGTGHGSPYLYDTHVPMVFWGGALTAARVDRAVYAVDIMPTLARRLGVSYPAMIDGVPLPEIAP